MIDNVIYRRQHGSGHLHSLAQDSCGYTSSLPSPSMNEWKNNEFNVELCECLEKRYINLIHYHYYNVY